MNKPYLKSMDFQGCKEFSAPMHIDFSPKLNVIIGSHGSGKSHILNAIEWCLSDSDDSPFDQWLDVSNNDEDIVFTEVSLFFGSEDNASKETVLKRRIACSKKDGALTDERFINGELVAKELFSGHL